MDEVPSHDDEALALEFVSAASLPCLATSRRRTAEEMASTIHRRSEPAAKMTEDEWLSKRIILIRHGRSAWNEFLGAHKKKCWDEQENTRRGYRDALKSKVAGIVRQVSERNIDEAADLNASFSDAQRSSSSSASDATPKGGHGVMDSGPGFWRSVRGNMKLVGNAVSQVDKMKQVDHSLSSWGLNQARQLRRKMAGVVTEATGAEAALMECDIWYVSPFLRAVQTAAFALSPLHTQRPSLRIRVTPQLNEFCSSRGAMDCHGKKGNVGLRLMNRAIMKTCELADGLDEGLAATERVFERQAEMAETTATFCAMNYDEVMQPWCQAAGAAAPKSSSGSEDLRVRQLVSRLLEEKGTSVGIVGHSMFFRRLIQLFWPKDPLVQEVLRIALRNGSPASENTLDPFSDKMINCGVLVLKLIYKRPDDLVTSLRSGSTAITDSAEIVGAEFLFDGHMEDALDAHEQAIEGDAGPEAIGENVAEEGAQETSCGSRTSPSCVSPTTFKTSFGPSGFPDLKSFLAESATSMQISPSAAPQVSKSL